jgi:NAD(P)-dependent dehydrogenase (short-subunit alcohol dehydrogenase family)
MKDKVCLVTGSNSGTGYVTALELAKTGARVVMLCRNKQKGETAQNELIHASGNSKVDLIIADLAEMHQVRNAVLEFKANYKRLDVLVNNAGGMTGTRKETSQGLEAMFAGNYLGHYLLTMLLLDELKTTAPARIINVSSLMHKYTTINFDDLQSVHTFSAMKAYGQTKLAQLLFTYELAGRLQVTGITVNALHPGVVASGFKNGVQGVRYVLASIVYKSIGISPAKGAETIVFLATSPEIASVTGKYFVKCKARTIA